MYPVRILLCSLITVAFAACKDGEKPPIGQQPVPRARTAQACGVLKQEEIDRLFERPVGPGRTQILGEEVRQCAWPAQGIPEFVLQLSPPRRGGVREAAAIDESFLVFDLPDMGASAAVSVLNAKPGSGLDATVGIVAIDVGGDLLRMAPLRLAVLDGSARHQVLLDLGKAAGARLR